MKTLTCENICLGCPLRDIPDDQLSMANIPTHWGMSMIEFAEARMRDEGASPSETIEDLGYIHRAYSGQAVAVVEHVRRQVMTRQCVFDTEVQQA